MKFRPSFWRTLAALFFILAAVAGLVFHTGWGTLSSFGIGAIAAVCPLGAIESALAAGSLAPRVIVALVVFVIAGVLLGRIFCGWACPVPLIERAAGKRKIIAIAPQEKTGCKASSAAGCASCTDCTSLSCTSGSKPDVVSGEKPSKAPYYILGGALASSAVFGFPVFCLICPVGLTFALIIGLWQLFAFNIASWSLAFFAGFLLLEIFVLRRWCRNFCPLGAVMTIAGRLNCFWRPKINRKACLRTTRGIACETCRSVCPEGIDLTADAIDPALMARCTKCRACAQACPVQAISFPFRLPAADKSNAKSTAPVAAPLMAPREEPPKLPAPERIKTFDEVTGAFSVQSAVRQASRCLRCGACEKACPQGNPIAAVMAAISDRRLQDAASLLLAPGAMPEICGRVCPQQRLCESVCPLAQEGLGGAVPIGALTRFASDAVLTRGWRAPRAASRPIGRAAVVGAGPAGLACADALARASVAVTLFEKNVRPGGLLASGIPAFKLSPDVLDRRIKLLEREGVQIKCGAALGRDVSFEDVLQSFDAVFVATGAQTPAGLVLAGGGQETDAADNTTGKDEVNGRDVIQALDFLRDASARIFKKIAQSKAARKASRSLRRDAPAQSACPTAESVPKYDVSGRRVVVLGGGDTAMDCLRTAIREGALEALCIYHHAREGMHAVASEIENAREEGARFVFNAEVVELVRGADGTLSGVRVRSTQAAEAGASETLIAADLVIVAYGFVCELPAWLAAAGVKGDAKGRVLTGVDGIAGRTTNPKVFAGGDMTRGADLVTTAVADARMAARAIVSQLQAAQKEKRTLSR